MNYRVRQSDWIFMLVLTAAVLVALLSECNSRPVEDTPEATPVVGQPHKRPVPIRLVPWPPSPAHPRPIPRG
jgi:hypothetical protein